MGFCPHCRYEFLHHVTHCETCDVSLVEELPPPRMSVWAQRSRRLRPALEQTRRGRQCILAADSLWHMCTAREVVAALLACPVVVWAFEYVARWRFESAGQLVPTLYWTGCFVVPQYWLAGLAESVWVGRFVPSMHLALSSLAFRAVAGELWLLPCVALSAHRVALSAPEQTDDRRAVATPCVCAAVPGLIVVAVAVSLSDGFIVPLMLVANVLAPEPPLLLSPAMTDHVWALLLIALQGVTAYALCLRLFSWLGTRVKSAWALLLCYVSLCVLVVTSSSIASLLPVPHAYRLDAPAQGQYSLEALALGLLFTLLLAVSVATVPRSRRQDSSAA